MSPRPQQRQPPPPRSTTTLCLVWDLDETLILLDSLCLQAQGADSGARREAGCELRRCVLDLAARRFHLDKLGGGTEGEEEEDEAEEESEEEGEGGAEIGGGGGKKNAGVKLLAAEAVSAYDSVPRFCLSAEASLEAARARSAVDAVSGGWLRAASRLGWAATDTAALGALVADAAPTAAAPAPTATTPVAMLPAPWPSGSNTPP